MATEYCQIVSYGVMAASGSGSKNIVNVYNWRRTNIVNPLSKVNIESAFQTAIMVPVTAALAASYTQSKNSVRFFDDATDPPFDVARAVAGAIATVRAESFLAAVIRFKTGIKGRSGMGRKHYGPIADADAEGDVLLAGAITRFGTVKTAVLAGFTDSDSNVWVPIVLSTKLTGGSQLLFNPTTVIANDITSGILNKTVGTMRRRKTATVV